jgi:FkbM family methyltransferase
MINWPNIRNPKKNAFVLTSTDVGSMIINRFDYHKVNNGTIGVGFNLLESSVFDAPELNVIMQVLSLIRQHKGDGVIFLDGGANIGVHTVTMGRLMYGWGNVISVEAQERIFYALAGNVTINNLFNVRVLWNALSNKKETIEISVPDYQLPASFGSIEMIQTESSEFVGQQLTNKEQVQAITIDSLNLPRLDYLKLDVEGMEELVLEGAKKTIKRCRPIIQLEVLKSDKQNLIDTLKKYNYVTLNLNQENTLSLHVDDPVLSSLKEN